MKSVFIGGVESSYFSLLELCKNGIVPSIAFGYGDDMSWRAGYYSLRSICSNRHIPLITCKSVKSHAEAIKEIEPDYIFCIGWSELLPKRIIEMAKVACIGMHPSALPIGRGCAAIPWTIIHGIKLSAVTMFAIDGNCDTGDIIDQEAFEIHITENANDVHTKVNAACAKLIRRNIDNLKAGTIPRTPQTGRHTKYPKRTPSDSYFDPNMPFKDAYNFIRALSDPYPNAFTEIDGETIYFKKIEAYRA